MQATHEPPAISVLARHLMTVDPYQQWEFAAVTLDVLLDSYASELLASTYDEASTAARSAKLARWQRATQGLINQLQAARTRLGQGAPFNIHVDRRHQMLIIVDGRAIVVSGPRSGTENEIATPILKQYCAYNDCSILQARATTKTAAMPETKGNWVLSQGMRPAYETTTELRCEFDSIANRDRKAQTCEQLGIELQRLAGALRQAAGQGHSIGWEALAAGPPTGTSRIVVNTEGAYLRLKVPLLGLADKDDWRAMLAWLRQKLDGGDRKMLISDTEHYLSQ